MWYGIRIVACLVVCLLLASGTFSLMAKGEATMRLYQEALRDHSQGKYAEAISKLEGVTRQDPAFTAAFSDLGGCYAEQRNYSKAIECFNRALSLAPADVGVLNNLAGVYMAMSDFPHAKAALEKIVSIDGSHEKARFQLAVIYLKENSADQALREAEWLMEKEPGNMAYRILQIHGYQQKGNRDTTRELCSRALDCDPGNREIMGILASLDRPDLPVPGPSIADPSPGGPPVPVTGEGNGRYVILACLLAVAVMAVISIPLRKWMTADPFLRSKTTPHELFAGYESPMEKKRGGRGAAQDEQGGGERLP